MIKDFADKETKLLWEGVWSKKIPTDIQRKAQAKLGMINNIKDLSELSVPPGNHLHSLKGSRKGQHAIRINDQWRICFNFIDGHAFNVEITDYH